MASEPVRVTTAATSHADDIRRRQQRYLISMAVRTACFVGAVAVGPGIFRWILVAGAVLLPYFAVVVANQETRKREDFQPTSPGGGPELTSSSRYEI